MLADDAFDRRGFASAVLAKQCMEHNTRMRAVTGEKRCPTTNFGKQSPRRDGHKRAKFLGEEVDAEFFEHPAEEVEFGVVQRPKPEASELPIGQGRVPLSVDLELVERRVDRPKSPPQPGESR